MNKAKTGDTVKVSYIGTLSDGTVFDKSTGTNFLEFVIGSGKVIKGFNNAVEGMELNETKSVTILSKDAYGEHLEDNIGTIKRELFPDSMKIEIDQVFDLQDDKGNTIQAKIIEFNDDEITVDTNHFLAGKDLTFEITLKEISN